MYIVWTERNKIVLYCIVLYKADIRDNKGQQTEFESVCLLTETKKKQNKNWHLLNFPREMKCQAVTI